MKIFKYPFRLAELVTISMPKGAQLLHFDNQRGVPTVWALVDPDAELEDVLFMVIGTGGFVPPPDVARMRHVGTALFENDNFVWHLFVVGGKAIEGSMQSEASLVDGRPQRA